MSAIRPDVCIAILALAAILVTASGASAHGPCGETCLEPESGPPGTVVTTEDLEGVLAVWNPRPNTLALGVPGMSRRCDVRCARAKPFFHLDQPSVILAEADPRAQFRFTVPDVPAGRYLIVVYDGSEGGFHYTWEFFRVTEAASRGDIRETDSAGTAFWVLAGVLLLVVLVAAFVSTRRTLTAG